jgi:hypothetical protein
MRRENYPFVACEEDDWEEDDCKEDDFNDLDDDVDTSGDERISYESACKLVESEPTLWSIFDFDMLLTECALSEVFIASGQYNWSTTYGGDEEIEIFGAFQSAAEARAAVDPEKKRTEDIILRDFHNFVEDEEEDVPLSPNKFPSTLLIPEKEITEIWHPWYRLYLIPCQVILGRLWR